MIFPYFLPEHIGASFLHSRSSAAVFITKRFVRVAVVRAVRTQRFIEKLIEEPIVQNTESSREELVAQALARACEQIPGRQKVISLFPSAQAVNKMVRVPLMSEEKVKMIIPFEIEGSLPFALNEASIDSLITSTNPEAATAQALVVATRKSLIEQHRALYQQSGLQPSVLTTELVALIGLFTDALPSLTLTGNAVIICIEEENTHILVMKAQSVVMVRTLVQGVLEQWNPEEIVRTVEYCVQALPSDERSAIRYILCGSGIEHKELCSQLTDLLRVEVELLTINKILHSGIVHSTERLTAPFLLPIAAALPASKTDSFNVDQEARELQQKRYILTNAAYALGITLLLFLTLFTTRFFVTRSLKREASASEQEAIDLLKTRLNLKDLPRNATLEMVNGRARATVANQEEIWFSLSGKNRSTALLALQELSRHVDREKMGLNLQEITISENTGTMTLKGEVRDFPELSMLLEGLRKSDFFKNIPSLQEKKFTAKISLDITTGEQ